MVGIMNLMKKTAVVFSLLSFLLILFPHNIFASIKNDINVKSQGGNSSVKVNVQNNLGSTSQTFSSSSETGSETNTNVSISQTGEGTSEVKINGQEWKLEGPGEINVNENSISSTPTSVEASPTPTDTPTPTEVPDSEEETTGNIFEKINDKIEEFKNSIQKLFSNLFKFD